MKAIVVIGAVLMLAPCLALAGADGPATRPAADARPSAIRSASSPLNKSTFRVQLYAAERDRVLTSEDRTSDP